MENYKGFEIETCEEEGATLYGWRSWSKGPVQWHQTIEDLEADIEDYLDGEREAAMERRAEQAMEDRLFGE